MEKNIKVIINIKYIIINLLINYCLIPITDIRRYAGLLPIPALI